MWLVFVPLVAAWCALPWLALTHDHGWLALPSFTRDGVAYPGCAGLQRSRPLSAWR